MSDELNRSIKSCHIDNEFKHENTAEMVKRTQPVNKFYSCESMNAEGTGVSHTVIDCYTRLPVDLVVSAKRFNENGVKVTKRVYPSPILEISEVTYYFKAVVRHSRSLEGGHYNTALNMKTLWVVCDDSKEFNIIEETPFDGYLFFYERSPLKLSKELHESLEAAFAVQRDDALENFGGFNETNYSKISIRSTGCLFCSKISFISTGLFNKSSKIVFCYQNCSKKVLKKMKQV